MNGPDAARLLCLAALWGGSFAFMRVAVAGIGPVWLVESRVLIAFLALLAVARLRAAVPAFAPHARAFVFVGVVNTAIPFSLFAWAANHIPASTGAMLNATSPFFAAIVAAVWLRERIGPVKIAGMAVGFAGVALLVGWHPHDGDAQAGTAILACLVASLCYGVASVYARRRLSGLPSFSAALYSQMVAAIALAPGIAIAPAPASVTPLVAINVLGLALASTALAYLLYFKLIATIGPARALTVTFLIPMFGVLWGWLFLAEAITGRTLGACGLIVIGTWLAVRAPRRDSASAALRRPSPSS